MPLRARHVWLVAALLLEGALTGCATTHNSLATAVPLPNFFKVDEELYRGAQPTPEGFRQLQALGIKTIVSLRALRPSEQQAVRRQVESLGMRWVWLPMRMYWRPTEEQVREFLAVAMDPSNQPVFVHCQHGEDRTGSLVAVYRVVKQGWRPEAAYQEALALGMADWNPFMRDLIFREAVARSRRTARSAL